MDETVEEFRSRKKNSTIRRPNPTRKWYWRFRWRPWGNLTKKTTTASNPPRQNTTTSTGKTSASNSNASSTPPQVVLQRQNPEKYINCFSDSYTNKIGSGYTPSTCIQTCNTKGYKYAGVNNGGDCYCTDQTPQTISTQCKMACTASNAKQYYCGGQSATDVYNTNFTLPTSNSNNSNFKGYYGTTNGLPLPQLLTTNVNNIQDCLTTAKNNKYSIAGIYQNNNCYGGNFDTYSANGVIPNSSVETSVNYQNNQYLSKDKSAFTGSTNSMGIFSTGYANKQNTNNFTTNHVGCYTKSNVTQSLKQLNSTSSTTTMTIDQCKRIALNNNYNYAMINNNKCYGTNNIFVNETKVDNIQCYISCNDDNGYCGSNNNYSVFSTFQPTNANYIGSFKFDSSKMIDLKTTVTNSVDALTKVNTLYPYVGSKPTGNQFNLYGILDINNLIITNSSDKSRIDIYSKSLISNNSLSYCGTGKGNYIENKNRSISVPWNGNSLSISATNDSNDCGKLCDTNASCNSYYYDTENKLCYNYNNKITDSVKRGRNMIGNKMPTTATTLSNDEINDCYNIFYNNIDNNQLDIKHCLIPEDTNTSQVRFNSECIYNSYQLINKVNNVYTVNLSPLDNTFVTDPVIDNYTSNYSDYISNVSVSE